nr:MAG TPA: hypothetical protein [Caudoviricetes sp.]
MSQSQSPLFTLSRIVISSSRSSVSPSMRCVGTFSSPSFFAAS